MRNAIEITGPLTPTARDLFVRLEPSIESTTVTLRFGRRQRVYLRRHDRVLIKLSADSPQGPTSSLNVKVIARR